jgi:hypothetical protein
MIWPDFVLIYVEQLSLHGFGQYSFSINSGTVLALSGMRNHLGKTHRTGASSAAHRFFIPIDLSKNTG